MRTALTFVSLLFLVVFLSCEREEFTTDANANIRFSADTVTFDTIFTQIGSVTKRFTIHNPNDKYITVSRLYLEGGQASNFRINVDGVAGPVHNDVIIPPKDSLYIFVEVTLDPVGGNLPLVVYDAIVAETNGNLSEAVLEAFGQDVHLINGEIIETQTWINDKPYLVYNSMAVDSNHTLTIEKGVQIYFHYNSSMLVWGKLIVNGTLTEPVVFEGDRFDQGYGESAGRWGTVYIDPKSRDNEINYAIIKNAIAGMQVGEPRENDQVPSVLLRNTIITNSSFSSIIAYNAEITGYNCIFSDAQLYGLALSMGGKYNFYHSTLSMVGAIEATVAEARSLRDSDGNAVALTNYYYPYAYLNDYYWVEQKQLNYPMVEANFYNSIITGNNKLEFLASDNEETDLNYFFDHCILKQLEDSIDINDNNHFNNILLNEYPRFVNDTALSGELDYRLDTLSPAKDIGDITFVNDRLEYLQYDYDGNLRTADGKPDLGAYERQE